MSDKKTGVGSEWRYESKTPFERHLAERVEFLIELVTSLHLKAGEPAQTDRALAAPGDGEEGKR